MIYITIHFFLYIRLHYIHTNKLKHIIVRSCKEHQKKHTHTHTLTHHGPTTTIPRFRQ